ncbi:hypothetical protein KAF25_001353 [Fusarium avenaceum]|uniref:Nephrocystin 3-like N-terminal domain-containing protein n=1 Tax=Fusarium avenaceum TaxID=40199 RepID=A0A9P7HEP6_9HYPO|nr:hypothetical protein KAF25_001353 [Fusarium avenaceum]
MLTGKKWAAVDEWLRRGCLDPHQMSSNAEYKHRHEVPILEGTGTWLIDSPSFQEWAEPNSATKILWLHGNAGYGKSVLCVQAIQKLEKRFTSWFGNPADAAVHFYDSNDEQENPCAIYRNIASKLFRQKYLIDDEISDALHHFAGMDLNDTMLKEFIKVVVGELETAYIFIDGVDEVFHHRDQRQMALGTLSFFLSLTKNGKSDVKLWCSSQPREQIRQLLTNHEFGKSLAETELDNTEDIAKFLLNKMGNLSDSELKLRKMLSLWEMPKTIQGNFLFAAVLTEAIVEAASGSELDELLSSLPKTFEEYLRKKIRCIKPENYGTFSKIMSCLIYAKRPLSFGELREAMGEDELDLYRIQEQCAPFVHIETNSQATTSQPICGIYHSSVRRFIEDNPDIVQSEAGQDSDSDVTISRRILATATLDYLRQSRYRNLLRVKENEGSRSITTRDGSNIESHHLLVYSAKYWAKHVDELQDLEHARVKDEIYKEIDDFVKSKNFETCLQVQSLFVQGRFNQWYTYNDRKVYYSTSMDVKNAGNNFTRNLPSFFTKYGSGKSLHKQYQDAIIEWGYFLRSFSPYDCQFPGQLDKCLWSTLGSANFMNRIESQLKGYALEVKGDKEFSSLSRGNLMPSSVQCGQYGRVISAVYLTEWKHAQVSDLQVEVHSWIMKSSGSRYKLQKKFSTLECEIGDLQLYTQALKFHQTGRPTSTAMTLDNYVLRIGSNIYVRDERDDFELVEFIDSRIEYIEDIFSSGTRIAVVYRRGMTVMDNRENHCGLEIEQDQSRAISQPLSSKRSTDSSSESDDDTSSDEDDIEKREEMGSISDLQVATGENDDIELDTQPSNSARESQSDGSTTQDSDELVDDDIWNDWWDIDEGLDKHSQISAEEMSDASSGVSEEHREAEAGVDAMSIESGYFGDHLSQDNASLGSLKSEIPLELWGDGSSVSERSDEESEHSIWDEPSERRLCDRRELLIFEVGRSTERPHVLFRYASQWGGRLFNSPPAIHPTHPLAVWPMGRNEILFANFTTPSDKTYFIRTLGCGSKDMCHISVQPRFSSCGQFLHIACLDGDTGGGNATDPERKGIKAIRSIHLRVFTYRLSQRRLVRSPPRLVYRAEVRLDCYKLGDMVDNMNRLSASPLPYALTWTEEHVYATKSSKTLCVYRLPLFRKVEERELEEPKEWSERDSEPGPEIEPNKTQVAFMNTCWIYLPNSADRRTVRFFPVVVDDSESMEGNAKTGSARKSTKRERKKYEATVVIEPEDRVTSEVSVPYTGPAQVIHLTADQLGPWKRVESSGIQQRSLYRWKGGQLQARYERFDNSNDCDIVPYFR